MLKYTAIISYKALETPIGWVDVTCTYWPQMVDISHLLQFVSTMPGYHQGCYKLQVNQATPLFLIPSFLMEHFPEVDLSY